MSNLSPGVKAPGATEHVSYESFIDSKRIKSEPCGFDALHIQIMPGLFPFQLAIVRWAIARGRAAIFADCGLGKTPMQLAWASYLADKLDGNILILAPLAVTRQTEREGAKFGVAVNVCRMAKDLKPGINVTNYDRLQHFEPSHFKGIVLDESSILKSFDGIMRKQIQEFAESIAYRLACTATPAPNDLTELSNHAEFLSIMQEKEIKALFFTQDGNTASVWRLKGHARHEFWRWMATWAVAVRKPSDIGFEDNGFILPPLKVEQVTVKPKGLPSGFLLHLEAHTMDERRAARRDSLEDRVKVAADLVNASNEPWILWCNLNAESSALAKSIPDAVEVVGSDDPEFKEAALLGFAEGKHRVLVTKPTIAGFGMNFQHCSNVVFVGLSDSYEQFYQAIRRCWRFGQVRPVTAYVVTATTEGAVVTNIERKEAQAMDMFDSIVREMGKELSLNGKKAKREEMVYEEDVLRGDSWTLYRGDCVHMVDKIESESVGLTVFSPPFPGMYTYTNSPHDMGNTRDLHEMISHFKFLVAPEKLLRVMMPGRSCCVHLTQAVAKKGVDGYIGIKDFRGRVISLMEEAGWIYYGEVAIDKDPQVKAIRTHDQGLLFKSLATDSAKMHMALADYLLQFKKPGDNPVPIKAGISDAYKNEHGWITADEWIEWAAPVWYRAKTGIHGGIRETDVLNVACARESDDERHLCPLQLGVIERAVKLWSAPGETVLSPFAGIGSEGYQSILLGRKFIGIELKESYWRTAAKNLAVAEHKAAQPLDIFRAAGA